MIFLFGKHGLIAATGLVAASGWMLGMIMVGAPESRPSLEPHNGAHDARFLQSPLTKCPQTGADDRKTPEPSPVTAGAVAGSPVVTSVVPRTVLRCTPHRDATIVRSYGLGHRFIVTGTYGNWLSVKILRDGGEGWIRRAAVVAADGSDGEHPRLELARAIPAKQSEPPAFAPSTDASETQRPRAADGDCRWIKIAPGQWTCRR